MPSRIQMFGVPHVLSPNHCLWVLRPGDNKVFLWNFSSQRVQPCFELWLAVGRIGPHVAHVTGKSLRLRTREIMLRVYRAEQWFSAPSAKPFGDLCQQRSSGETKVNIKL